MKRRPKQTQVKVRKLTHDTIPATVGLVKAMRNELQADNRAVRHEVGSLRNEVSSLRKDVISVRKEMKDEFASVREEMKDEFVSVRKEMREGFVAVRHELGSQIETMMASVHRTEVLMEEQRGENKIVLDGLKNVLDRQDRVEAEVADFRETLKILKKPAQV